MIEMVFIWFRFLGFWFCIDAFSLGKDLLFFDWLAAFSLAWVIGLVIPAAPGGIGIFESIILLLLSNTVSDPPLISALLFYRFSSTMADCIMLIIVKIKSNKNLNIFYY